MPGISSEQLVRMVDGIANRWPTVGLAVGVVRDGSVEFVNRGLADIASRTPITEDTVFRIASLTKTFTAIAVMQLWERGLVDLDAPAEHYLRAYRLVPARTGFRPVTIRHLLTHTAGIREVLHPSGLLRMRDLGETVPADRRVPSLAEYYGGRLRVDANPGSRWTYTDHGFATLGQIVADVTGQPFDRYLREYVLDPLGMTHTDLVRSAHAGPAVATGYELRRRGAVAIPDYVLVPSAAGALCSSPRDMARYLAALLGGGTNEHGTILKPATLAFMFEPQYQPDPRISGMGLAFFRTDLSGHLAVEHDGILPGFDAHFAVAPEDGAAVMAFANGARRGMHWLVPEVTRILRRILERPEAVIRDDVPQHPEIWADLCGRYRFSTYRTDPARLAFGPGAEVVVRRGRLMLRFRGPIPALRKGFLLYPDDPADPYVFRIEFPYFAVGTTRVVFSRTHTPGVTALHLEVGPTSFHKGHTEDRPW